MRKIAVLSLILVITVGISAFSFKSGTPDDDPVYYWNHYTGPTYNPVVTVVLLSDIEAQEMSCSGIGYKCLVKLNDQLQETDIIYQRSQE